MSKKKIFYVLSVFLLLGMTMSVLNARAHPPINIDIEYDVGAGQLSVIYTHGVSDPHVHYLETIEVWVNVTQRWVEHGSEGKYVHHGIYYRDLDSYAIAVPPPLDPSDVDPYHDDYYETIAPDYIFYYTSQPTDITPITTSHTIARYILDVPGLNKTGETVIVTDPYTGEEVQYLGEGRTNMTIRANCTLTDSDGDRSLTEHYYVGLPYYNPHLTFAEAAIPGIVSTVIVFALLFILPKLGQKNAPKLEEEKKKH